MGVAYLDDRVRKGAFGPQELSWVRLVAGIAAMAITDARSQLMLQREARRAKRAEARVNFRVLPDESPEHVIEAVEALIDDAQIEVSTGRPWAGNPGVADIGGDGYARIRAALEASVPDFVVVPGLLMATTDSRHYKALTPNVYRFHPMTIDVEDAKVIHGTNERIPVAGIELGVEIVRELIPRVGAR